MIISLWTVPVILGALGQSDYGLYNLVAGVVAMLTFLNGSMTVVMQRYMSVTMGSGDKVKLNQIYNAGIRIHIVLGITIVILLELCTPFLFNGFLNIDSERTSAAIIVYQFMIVNTLFTILSVPFDSALNAYENMLVFSLIAVTESVMKLILAFMLMGVSFDRLIFYGLGLAVISVLGIVARGYIVNRKYKELRYNYKLNVSKALYKEMISYAGWNTFGSIAIIGKNQGISIVLNTFFGTLINASYGIANQINGLLSNFTASIQKAISPQLMKHEGANHHESMIAMSFSLVKVSTIVFALMALPAVIEMEQLLTWWLKDNIPPYTIIFCQLIITVQLLFQLSSGIALAIDAVGKIRNYRIVLSLVMIFNIPIAYILLLGGLEPYMVIISMILIEILCLVVRLYFAHKTAGFPLFDYLKKCLFPLLITILISFVGGCVLKNVLQQGLIRLILVALLSSLILCVFSYYIVLNKTEKNRLKKFSMELVRSKNK
jgi:O-antigen/teichoic acid export membrane protein